MDLKRTLLATIAVGVVVGGCTAATDNNRPCTLVKKGPNGTAVAITEGELTAKAGFSKDFITFGTVECEDLVCARDSNFKPTNTDPTLPAQGYCSRPCAQNSKCPSFDPKMDTVPSTALNCRPLLLDETTLKEVCKDPGACQSVNNVQSPYFCARGSVAADGGI